MPEITKEQARLKAIELIETGKTLEQAECTPELVAAVRELAENTFGIKTAEQIKNDVETEEPKPADMPELIRQLNLEAQYGERLNTLKHYGFLAENSEAKEGNVEAPSFEKAMSTFKPEEFEIANNFQKPTLLLIPETSFEAKVKAMDAHKQGVHENRNSTYVDEIYTDSDSGSDKITGWRAVIVDGAQEMKTYEDDDLELEFVDRIRNRKEALKTGENGMERHRYALLMMEALRNGDPIDKTTYTFLDDDPALSAFDVPLANFLPYYRGEVGFDWNRPDSVGGGARFRSSVGGDVLIS